MSRKELYGKVVSNKMQKTVVVAVENRFPHSKYEKQIVRTNKFKAHDEDNKCDIGDMVRIQECRPLSKDKHFRVIAIVEKSQSVASAVSAPKESE